MKKIITFILFALLLLPLNGQIGRYPFYTATISDPYCPEYRAVYNAMTVKPGPDTAHFQSDMVYSLDSAGYWDTQWDIFYVFAQRTNANGEAWINWMNPGTYDVTDPGGTAPTFTVYEGFTGNSDYLSTNWNPSSDAELYLLNDATIGVYSRTDVSDENYSVMGVRVGNDMIIMNMSDPSNNMAAYVNDNNLLSTSNNGSLGLFFATRTSSTAVENIKNGSSLGTGSSGSNKIPDGDMYILSYNWVGTGPFSPFPGQVSIVMAGKGLTADDAAKINTIIERYMDRLGKGVQ